MNSKCMTGSSEIVIPEIGTELKKEIPYLHFYNWFSILNDVKKLIFLYLNDTLHFNSEHLKLPLKKL